MARIVMLNANNEETIILDDKKLASTSNAGIVKPDGETININAGLISVPKATVSTAGIVKPDGETITFDETTGAISIQSSINNLKSNFQAGVDSIYNAVQDKGTTPASQSLEDVVNAIYDLDGLLTFDTLPFFKESTLIYNKMDQQYYIWENNVPGIYDINENLIAAPTDEQWMANYTTEETLIDILGITDLKQVHSVVFPNTITNIGNNIFYNCPFLKMVTMSNTITKIGINAFYNCLSLNSIYLSNIITNIGDRAFYNCKSLTSIETSKNLTEIGDGAFEGCTSLISIVIPEEIDINNIGIDTFKDVPNVKYSGSSELNINAKSINGYVENGLVYSDFDKKTLMAGASNLNNAIIPVGVEKININAFKDCKILESIILPTTVKEIGENAFKNCVSLTSIITSNR